MKLRDMKKGAVINVVMEWERNRIEFHSEMHMPDEDDGIFITPYMRNGQPLPLHVSSDDVVVCSLFGDDSFTGDRITWKNVNLETVMVGKDVLYHITTMKFNSESQKSERRTKKRAIEEKPGIVIDNDGVEKQVVIHDISDTGVSFYTNEALNIYQDTLKVEFDDNLHNHDFHLKLKCRVVRTSTEDGKDFYGCMVLEPDREFLFYVLMYRKLNS